MGAFSYGKFFLHFGFVVALPPHPYEGLNRYSRNSGVPFDPAKGAVPLWKPNVAYSMLNYHLSFNITWRHIYTFM